MKTSSRINCHRLRENFRIEMNFNGIIIINGMTNDEDLLKIEKEMGFEENEREKVSTLTAVVLRFSLVCIVVIHSATSCIYHTI